MTEERYCKMLEITQQTKNYINNFFSSEEFETPVCKEEVWDFYQKRYKKSLWLRPYLTASFYEHFAKESFRGIIPSIAASEAFNISTYQSNIVFDNKISPHQINLNDMNQFIASYLSYNMANKMVLKINADTEVKVKLLGLLNECNAKIYKGQSLDLNMLICDNIGWLLDEENMFFDLYDKRCELIAGASVEYCALSPVILLKMDDDKDLTNYLYQLSKQWGSIMQIINDLSDYVFINNTKERYFDIRADKLTLPLFLIMKEIGLSKTEDFITSFKSKDDKLLEEFFMTYLYKDSPIVKEIFSLLKNKWELCREYINRLGLSKEFSQGLFESAFLNKYSRKLFSNALIKQLKAKYNG